MHTAFTIPFLSALLCFSAPLCAAENATVPIPIHQADIPIEITSPGSYQLAEDIVSAGDAITVAAHDVTIDLDGFTITGPGRDAHQPASAISSPRDSEIHRVTILNGTIGEFPTSAIHLPEATHASIRKLRIHDIGEIGIDVGDEADIRTNHLNSLGIRDATRTGAVIGIRAGLNSTIEQNTISGLHHEGNGQLDAIRVERGCYVIDNRIDGLTTVASGTGDVIAIACATMAADIRANKVDNVTNSRPGGIAIGIRIGSGSAEENRVSDISAASLAIGIQGIAAVFIERNEVHRVLAIRNGPDAYGIWAAGTGGRVTHNIVRGVDCQGDESRNREIGIRANSAFEITNNRIQIANAREHAHQAGIEISGRYNVIVENSILIGDPGGPPGVAIYLGALTLSNTIGGNETGGRVIDKGISNRVPNPTGEVPVM